jgi:hypothetical protein
MAYLDTVKTAQQVVAEDDAANQNAFDQTARDLAEAAGVTHSEYVNYAARLTNYESRDDVEPLAERRAREAGDQFSDTDFRRAGTGSIAVFTSPGDQNVG